MYIFKDVYQKQYQYITKINSAQNYMFDNCQKGYV